jgi:2-amino-4-hydroxy-6-hydroxymethyldihydropteridine diphosphokinase
MHKLYISLGSNLGNKEEKLRRAIELINERIGSVLRTSSFIETEPWGFQSENTFLNAACLVETHLTPMQCLRKTQEIERLLGRMQKSTNGIYHDRPIDLDILLYDDLEMNTPELVLPHPHMQERDFVMIPLREIMDNSECSE